MSWERTRPATSRALLMYPSTGPIALYASSPEGGGTTPVAVLPSLEWVSMDSDTLSLCVVNTPGWIVLDGADPSTHSEALRGLSRFLATCDTLPPTLLVWVICPRDSAQFRQWPSLVQRTAIMMEEDLHHDVLRRALLVAVEDSHRHETMLRRGNISAFPDALKIDLFDKVSTEDVFMILLQRTAQESVSASFAAKARDANGRSVLDVAIGKGYLKGAALCHDLGAHSETIDLQCFLDVTFQPMLDILLDPLKPFPFDAVAVIATVALWGRFDILGRMFDCRVDREFTSVDYPILEALSCGAEAVVQLVIDRLGIVGYSPIYDGRVALHFALRIIALSRKLSDIELRWLCVFTDSALRDDLSGVVRMSHIQSLALHHPGHRVVSSALRIVDITAATLLDDPLEMASLFVRFDPTSPKVCDALACAIARLSGTVAAQDEALHRLVRSLARASDLALPTLTALCGMLSEERLSMGYKLAIEGPGGSRRRTQVMQCLDYPPSPSALALFLSRIPLTDRTTLETVNEVGNTALQQMLVEVSCDPLEAYPHTAAIAACADLLLARGVSVADPSHVKTSLLRRVAKTENMDLAWTLSVRPRNSSESWVLVGSDNLRALMYAAHGSACDTRIEPGTPSDKYGMPECLLRIPMVCVENVAAFLLPSDIASLGTVSVRMHFATLAKSVWAWRVGEKESSSHRRLVSSKKMFRDCATCAHFMVPGPTGTDTCMYCQ